MICCARTGGRGKHNIFSLGGAFRKAKYEIRRRRKNRNRKARVGKNSFPPNPLPFCPPERSVSVVPPTAGAIIRDFAQKRFELRSAIATNQDISNFQGKEFAYTRIFPYISELNRKVGQIQIQFFGKANGGSELRSNSQMKFVSNFFRFLPKAKIQSKFLINGQRRHYKLRGKHYENKIFSLR